MLISAMEPAWMNRGLVAQVIEWEFSSRNFFIG